MKKLLLLFVLLLSAIGLNYESNSAVAAGETFTGTSSYSITRDDTITFSDLQISGTGNDNLNINVFVPYGSLEMSSTNGIIFNSATVSNNLNFEGSRSNVNSALQTLKFSPSLNIQQRGNVNLQITIGGLENSVYSPITHHIYQSSGISTEWQYAKSGAESFTYQGAEGYLATITSQEEQDAVAQLKRGGWIGASDLDNEGEWVWVSGPEAGQNFWNGGADGNLVDGYYHNWVDGMPDNYNGSNPNGENCMEIYSGDQSFWNDQNCDSGSIVGNYVIEYGDDENTLDLTYKNISISISNGRDLNRDGIEDFKQANVRDFLTPQNKWISLYLSGGCTFSNAELLAEGQLDKQDTEYDYLGGLVNFTASCGSSVGTYVRLYYHDETTEELLLRKYNPTNQTYSNINDAEDFVGMSDNTFNGQHYVFVQYILYDGGPLDSDGEVNGEFSDPIGVATIAPPSPPAPLNSDNSSNGGVSQPSNGLASTGSSAMQLTIFSLFVITLTLVYTVIIKELEIN